ncbi:hypothetical protein [Selenomonas sp. AE3005]|uniref:TRAFAC clade GTPase domain-containing protein n=1 Tax=Selenomonas sp. AE3005 TaxID=1485543 RepID=UPI000489198E|nr:hypothetical protein [Selenomonas sp. AE3005]
MGQMLTNEQDTKIAKPRTSYFFGPGYEDCLNIVNGAWAANYGYLKVFYLEMKKYENRPWWIALVSKIGFTVAMAMLIIFGSLFTAVISIIHVILMAGIASVVYIAAVVLWGIDCAYRKYNKIYGVPCTSCHTRQELPWYECPNCHKWHTQLKPGKFGLWKRTCECGEKLPTNFFNGRNTLQAVCSNPYCTDRLMGHDREYQTICIPIIGGTSAGKTAFLTAFFVKFKDNFMKDNKVEYRPFDSESQRLSDDLKQNYQHGSTEKTSVSSGAISFSFYIKHESFELPRIIHIYDIAGEVFTTADENVQRQKQYEYCNGFVFVLDPLSLPKIRDKYVNSLSDIDRNSASQGEIQQVFENFIQKIRAVSGLSERDLAKAPLAVVISKIDLADFSQQLGGLAVEKLYQRYPQTFLTPMEAEDYLCRKFLHVNGGRAFLNSIEYNFKNIRFFACSAMGHTAGTTSFTPEGVMAPMEWIIGQADRRGIGNIWKEHTFHDPVKPWTEYDAAICGEE